MLHFSYDDVMNFTTITEGVIQWILFLFYSYKIKLILYHGYLYQYQSL